MGNQLAPSGASSVSDLRGLLVEVPAFVHGQTLGLGKILKTAWCEHDEGRVIVKLYPKRYGGGGGGGGGGSSGNYAQTQAANAASAAAASVAASSASSLLSTSASSSSGFASTVDPELRPYERRLEDIRSRFALDRAPNVLPLARWIDGERAAFLVRQYVAYNLYDRLHTHPFLTLLEKRWMAFQLLEALRQLHAGGVRHGDVKTENLLCTSWNWLLLTDLAFYKPTYLPADNPADYSFYFETTRRRCYLAPERFYTAGEKERTLQAAYVQSQQQHAQTAAGAGSSVGGSGSLSSSASSSNLQLSAPAASNFDPLTVTEAMDVFSAGCCIAEIFLEGDALFDLPQLLSYREGQYDPLPGLQSRIADADIRDLISHMIQLNPASRFSAKGYLREWSPRSFPSSFAFLHRHVFHRMLSPEQLGSPDGKLQWIKGNERQIIREVAGVEPGGKDRADREKEREREQQRERERQREKEREAERQKEAQRQVENERKQARLSQLSPQQQQAADERKDRGREAEGNGSASSHNGGMSIAVNPTSGLGASLAAASARASASAAYGPLLSELSAFASTLEEQQKSSADGALKDWTQLESEARNYRKPRFASSLPPPVLRISPSTPSAPGGGAGGGTYSPSTSPVSSSVPRTAYHSPDSPLRRSPAPSSSSATSPQALAHSRSEDIRLDDGINSSSTTRGGLQSEDSSNSVSSVASGSGAVNSSGHYSSSNGGSSSLPSSSSSLSELRSVTTANSNALTLVVSLVCSCVQNVASPKMKLIGLELMLELGCYVEDEVRLGRIVPYCVALLPDSAPSVRAMAVSTLTRVLSLVNSFQQADSHIFPEYIFPALSRFPQDSEELVRLSYAANLAALADTSKKFLDLALVMQTSRGGAGGGAAALTPSPSLDSLAAHAPSPPPPPPQSRYESELAALQELVLRVVIEMWTEGGSGVKRALLQDIHRLCAFIGRKRVNHDLLGHLINILNDPDWQLRVSFFDHVSAVSVFVGRLAFQKIVLPCVEPALFDVEESVIQRAVHALTQLVQLQLFDKKVSMEIADMAGPLLCHPSAWIRSEAIAFVLAVADALGLAKAHCFLLPTLQPFLLQPIAQFSRTTLIPALKPPLTRAEFNDVVFRNLRHSASAASQPQSASSSSSSSSSAPSASLPDAFLAGVSYLSGAELSLTAQQSSLAAADGADGSSSSLTDGHHSHEDDGADRLRTVSTGSNASSLSLTSSSGSQEAAAAAGSGWQSDPQLRPAISRYLHRVANAVERKSYAAPVDGSASAVEAEAEELEQYSAADDEVPVYQVEVERTFADPTAAGGASSTVDRVQQDLLDSLGMQVQRQAGAANASAIRSEQQRQAADYLQQKAHPATPSSAAGSRTRREPIRQPLNKVPNYIQRALKIPPPPPGLGSLRESTISTSSFYRNHHQLEGAHEAVEPRQWRPRGVLVATLTEHSAAVNRLAVSRDNVFLVSGSDDGSVRVWDCNRLKLTANARSQLTYQQPGRVTSVCTCDSSHSIVSASDAGLVQVMKVEYAAAGDDAAAGAGAGAGAAAGGGHKYGGWSEVRRIDARHEGSVLAVEHFNTVTESLLLFGTQRGAVHSWDLRSKREPFLLQLEAAMGLLSALVIGPTPYCLSEDMEVLTDRGFMSREEVFAACPELAPSAPTPAPASDDAALPFGGAVLTRETSPLYWTPSPAEEATDEAAGIRYEKLGKSAGSAAQLRDCADWYGRQCGLCGERLWSCSQTGARDGLRTHSRREHAEEVAATAAARSGGHISVSAASSSPSASRRASLSTASTVEHLPLQEGDDPARTVSPRIKRSSVSHARGVLDDEDVKMDDDGFAIPETVSRPSLARPVSMPVAKAALEQAGRPASARPRSFSAPSAAPSPSDRRRSPFTFTRRDRSLSAASMDSMEGAYEAVMEETEEATTRRAAAVADALGCAMEDDDGHKVCINCNRDVEDDQLLRCVSCNAPVHRDCSESELMRPAQSADDWCCVACHQRSPVVDVMEVEEDKGEAIPAARASPAAASSPLLFASLDPSTGHLVYLPATALTWKTVTSLVEFTHHAEAPHWAEDADEYGLTPDHVKRMQAQSERNRRGEKVDKKHIPPHHTNGVSLIVDPQHDMFVRAGMTLSTGLGDDTHTEWASAGYGKVKAGSLLSDDPRQRVKMAGHAPAGLAASADELPFAAVLGMTTEDEVTAFLELYGYWCGDGSLHSESRTVAFSTKKKGEKPWVLERLATLGLTVEGGGVKKYDCANGQLNIYVQDRRWNDYFFGEYGPKYGVASLTSSRPHTHTGLTVPLAKSVKWFWVWVWRLRKKRARRVLAGLRFADGNEAADLSCVFTSGVDFRDEIVRLALHAGYAARFSLVYKAGDHRGYDSAGKAITARHDHWAVWYSDQPQAAEPVLHNHRDIAAVEAPGGVPVPVWCATVPPHNLIIARRARKNGNGVVTQASIPIVVGNCLIAGTSRGFVVVWDLRFQLPVQVWRHHSRSRIVSLTPHDAPSVLPKDQQGRYQHPTKGPLVFVAAEGTNQIAAFDLLSGECRMVMRVHTATAAPQLSSATAAAAQQQHHAAQKPHASAAVAAAGRIHAPPAASSGAAASASTTVDGQLRHKVSVSPLSLPSMRSYLRHDYPASLMDDSFIKELQSLSDSVAQPAAHGAASSASASALSQSQSITSFLVCSGSFCLTAGSDRVVRFWDLHEPIDSYRISQPEQPADDVVARYTGRMENSTAVMEEVMHGQHSASIYSASGRTGAGTGGSADEERRTTELRSALAKKSRGQSPPSSCHQSEIVDLKAIEFPQKMLATAGTDGMIKIWI